MVSILRTTFLALINLMDMHIKKLVFLCAS